MRVALPKMPVTTRIHDILRFGGSLLNCEWEGDHTKWLRSSYSKKSLINRYYLGTIPFNTKIHHQHWHPIDDDFFEEKLSSLISSTMRISWLGSPGGISRCDRGIPWDSNNFSPYRPGKGANHSLIPWCVKVRPLIPLVTLSTTSSVYWKIWLSIALDPQILRVKSWGRLLTWSTNFHQKHQVASARTFIRPDH